MDDLFNLNRALTPAERRRLQQPSKAKGYAALPGSGPAGETCGTCKHLVRSEMAKTYRKCGLMAAHWTRGPGSDILVRSPACRNWEKGEAPPKPQKAPKPFELPTMPPTMVERAEAARFARLLRAALPDRAKWGEPQTLHIDYSRPRRSEWITTWSGLPGFRMINGKFCHDLLPGWAYSVQELKTEMIPDLEALAERGIRPTEATS